MSSPALFNTLATLARQLLEPNDFDRMAMPAIADAVAESTRSSLRETASLASQLVRIITLATWDRIVAAAQGSTWWPLFATTVAGVAGAVGLQFTERGSLSHAQLVFLVVGLIAAVAVVIAPARIARTFGLLATTIAIAAIASVPWFGSSFHGAHRWLSFGSIAVHTSVLILPLFTVVVANLADRWPRPVVAAVVLATIALVLAQPDSPSALVYAITAAAACWRSRSRGWVLAASTIAAAAAFARYAPLPPVGHVEGAWRLLAAHGPLWLAAGAGALMVVLGFAARSWRALVCRPEAAARVYERRAAGASAGLAAMIFVPPLLGDGGLPLISYGGSAVFAVYVLMAVLIRSSREGLPRAGFRAA